MMKRTIKKRSKQRLGARHAFFRSSVVKREPDGKLKSSSLRRSRRSKEEDEWLLNEIVESLEELPGCLEKSGFGPYYNHDQLHQRLRLVLFGEEETKDEKINDNDITRNATTTLDKLEWLIEPLMEGLLQGGDWMNVCVSPPSAWGVDDDEEEEDQEEDDRPLLYWLCQWKYLQHAFGWKGSNDMVAMAMRRGASIIEEHPTAVDNQAPHQTSILTMAVQHGSVDTVRHLLYGVRRQQGGRTSVEEWIYREIVLQELFSKVLDRACPKILRLLLKYIPAGTERVWVKLSIPLDNTREDTTTLPAVGLDTTREDITTTRPGSGEELHVTALDYLLYKLWVWCCSGSSSSFAACNSIAKQQDFPSPCWAVVGVPSIEDYTGCLLTLMTKGVTLTPLTLSLISRFLCLEQRASSVSSSLRTAPPQPQQYACTAAQLLFGNWIPTQLREELSHQQAQEASNRQYAETTKQGVCVICLEDEKREDASHHRFSWLFRNKHRSAHNNPTTTLYCGHSFCIPCILEWGGADPEMFSGTRTVEASCPICRKPLAREFLSDRNRRWLGRDGDRRRNTLGIDHHHPPGPRGPQWLSRDQIAMECQARGLSIDAHGVDEAKQELERQWAAVRQQRRSGPSIMVDLAASHTLSPQHVAAKKGPVLIPIQVNGVPMLAGLSGSSPYTVISRSLVENLGLTTKKLASNRFQQFQCVVSDHAKEDSSDSDSCDSDSSEESRTAAVRQLPLTMKVVDELIVSLGDKQSGIEVSLRNAVVPVRDPGGAEPWRPGVVLGMDFLESAAWTQTTVEVDIAQSISAATNDEDEDENDLACRRFMVIVHGGQFIHRVTDSDVARSMPEEFRFYNGRCFRTPLLHIDTGYPAIANRLFFSAGHANANITAGRRRHQRFTECEFCCRMFPFVADDENESNDESGPWSFFRALRRKREQRPVAKGMMTCKFCCDMAPSMRQHVYYCDETCQQLAQNVHRLRHEQYRGILVSWCRILFSIMFGSIRKQRPTFSVSFVMGFAVSFWLSRAQISPLSALQAAYEYIWSVIYNAK